MTEFDVRSYVAAFNANDFDGFGRYYSEDVVYELWSQRHIEGRDSLLAFYRTVKAHVVDMVDVLDVMVSPSRIAMHCRVSYETIKDWPDPQNWRSRAGDKRLIETISLYDVARGRFTRIRAAKFKALEGRA